MSGSEKHRIGNRSALGFRTSARREPERYPTREFTPFAAVLRQPADATREDETLPRCGQCGQRAGPVFAMRTQEGAGASVLRQAERLECLLFGSYDPHFHGDEPQLQASSPSAQTTPNTKSATV
jgi:hypothetical protein